MKIAFSTLGCPDWIFPEIVSAAADLKYDGIEIRGIGNNVFSPDSPVFSKDNIEASASRVASKGLEISCIDTTCIVCDEKLWNIELIKKSCETAKALNCKYIRVLGDIAPAPGNVDDENVIAALKEICAVAAGYGVTVIIETNGVYSYSERLLKVISAVGAENLGVLWDIQHPYRVAGEEISHTASALAKYVKHVHIKDSVVENGKTVYKMTGYGDLPIKEAVSALKEIGFEGALSLEWLKRWNRDLEDPGIVFAHYIRAIKAMI
ncbi:MAG: sugar phosphate isomerase/epimerase [Clostridia bacterium]|nr:sugar phosphate isomerase/epimerase [Clostridia bacterium]